MVQAQQHPSASEVAMLDLAIANMNTAAGELLYLEAVQAGGSSISAEQLEALRVPLRGVQEALRTLGETMPGGCDRRERAPI